MTLGNVWLGSLQLKSVSAVSTQSVQAFSMETTALSVASVMDRLLLRVSGATTETMSIALRPADGTQYCSIVYRVSTSGYTSFFYQPDRPLFMYPGDQLVTTVSAGDSTGVIYASVLTLF